MTGYAEIAVTTNFSFLRGASHPKELVAAAAALGLDAVGIADRNTLAGVVRAYDAWRQIGTQTAHRPKLLVGARLVFADGTPDILAYPTDRAAYGRLCRLLSGGKLYVREGERRAWKGECTLTLADLLHWQEGLLLAVVPDRGEGGVAALENECGQQLQGVIRSVAKNQPDSVWLAAAMPHHGDDRRRLKTLRRIARAAGAPLLAINDVLYHAPGRRALQDVVTCIREHVTLDAAGKLLEANAERHLKSPDEMARLFRDAPEAIAETLRFAQRIRFTLDDIKYNYPDEPVPKGKTPEQHLSDLTWAGAAWRYPDGIPDKVRATLEKELALIIQLKIAPYFLTVHDIVRVANEKEILCQGRGSAANSAVCYMLGITAVDPTQVDLLFERFISQERREPPDIDVDFEHEKREDIIQDIYKRYGHDRAALTATVITYWPRSAIREVGKVFGLSEDVTAALVSGFWGSGGGTVKDHEIRQSDLEPGNVLIARTVKMTEALIGFPRHLSQHPGGFVLTRERLDTIVPIGPAAMENRFFIEWDKDDIDVLGIMKVDVLALGMLTCIRKAFDLIDGYSGKAKLTLATIPQSDAAVYDMLCAADAIGVFQVESRAQMNMLPRLRPREFYDLVIEVAIVRPGPIQGDMVHPYLKRRKNPALVDFPAPSPEHGPADELKGILGKTMGVPLFQEQAMKLAIVAARFTPDEANGLRRAMATFRNVGTIDKFRDKMIGGMVARGYKQEFAERCFKQIEGFGSYGFPESHAASFALLVYVSAWIKRYHPAAFACALLNSQPMGFYAPAEIVRDAREHDVEVRAPDVNFSAWDNILEYREDGVLALRLGFRQIEGFKEDWWTKAIAETRGNGFSAFDSFARRTRLPKRALIVLAEADCFRSLGLDRRESLWSVRRLPDDAALPLFAAQFVEDLPAETTAPLPVMPLSEHTVADYQTMRLSLKAHPMEFLRDMLRADGVMSCKEVTDEWDARPARAAGIVLTRQMPGAKGVVFVTLSDETGVCNIVVWPSVFQRFRKEVMGGRLLEVEGTIQRSPEGVVHLMAERFSDRTRDLDRLSDDAPPARTDSTGDLRRHPRNVRVLPKSRDFH